MWMLALPLPQILLRKTHRFDSDVAESILVRTERWIGVGVSMLAGSLYTFILTWTGVIDGEEARSFLIVSFVLLQLFFLYSVSREAGMLSRRTESFLPLLVTVASIAVLGVLSALLSPLQSIMGIGAWHLVTLLSLPLFPLLYFLSGFFYRIFYRTAK